jgi:superfamily I DNA/RNA helicase
VSNFKKWSTPTPGNDSFLRQKSIVVGLQEFMPTKRAIKKVFAAVDFINNKMKGDTLADKVKRVLSIMSSVSDDGIVIDRNVVTLATLHGSKGLEFKTVWIPDASDQKIPSNLKVSSIEAQNDEIKHIEDERRLFYVGITRAEEQLNITFNNVMGQFLANADMNICNVFDKNGDLIEANS